MTPKLFRYSAKRHLADDRTIEILHRVGYMNGYAVAVHGSQGPKDLDIIAVAWAIPAIQHDDLISAFCFNADLEISKSPTDQAEKPHGRQAYLLRRKSDRRVIDVSVMPPKETK